MSIEMYRAHVKQLVGSTIGNGDYHLFIHKENAPSTSSQSTRIIHVNVEHMIVKAGGRDVPEGLPCGQMEDEDGVPYRIRFVNKDNFIRADIVVDYSNANVDHVKSNLDLRGIAAKMVYVPPLIFPACLRSAGERSIQLLTTYVDLDEPRRKDFLDTCAREGIEITNVNNAFSNSDLHSLMMRTKIVVNMHQTDHHRTLEELRVLPALCAGCVVVSEEVPNKESIPYHRFVVWSSHEGIYQTIREVVANYEYHRRNLLDGSFEEVVAQMETDVRRDLRSKWDAGVVRNL